jgi:chemotaxis methyl-accepting protein methylase
VDLRAYRRTTVLRRMHGRMTRLRIGSLDAYRDLLEAADEEAH